MELNRFLTSLAELIAAQPVDEKWLLAPSRRVGFQWLDAITRAGRPILNTRVKTLRHLALDLAAPSMERAGLAYASPRRLEALVDGVFAELSARADTYLGRLAASHSLTQTVGRVLRDLRLGGLGPGDLHGKAFETGQKAGDIRAMLAAYETRLREHALVDYAGGLRLAVQRLRDAPSALSGARVVCPADEIETLSALEEELWRALPQERRTALPVDEPGRDDSTDIGRLSRLLSPGDAPLPADDGSARMFRAVGEANEAREVLRRCFEEGVPLDDVEVLYTDSQTYPELIHEMMSALQEEDAERPRLTLAEGLPAGCYRPGRALRAWLEWTAQGFPQMTLARMMQDGLLAPLEDTPEEMTPSKLAETLRSVPIGGGRDRYMRRLRTMAAREAPDRAERLKAVAGLVEAVLETTPGPGAAQLDTLRAAERFLSERARCATEMENYARRALLDEIRAMAECIEETGELAGFDAWGWLADLPREQRVGGLGPRPGDLHAAPLGAGGHSGRGHTFILGLDDTRFPGSGLQDPLLLDSERRRLGESLPTAGARLEQRMLGFARLLARLRGRVTLSYCCRSLSDDREVFPGPAALGAFRALSGQADGDHEGMARWVGPPVSFAPRAEAACLDASEWWMWRLCGAAKVENAEQALAEAFPHLARGRAALAARASDRFTEYDGYVPAAGADHAPARPGARPVSPTRLETFGACPLAYFFSEVLGIAPPEEHAIDPEAWLPPLERGQLMHTVFRRFMGTLRDEGRLPDYPADVERIHAILAELAAEATEAIPPPNKAVWEREMEDLRFMARIFVCEEAAHCRESGATPAFLEAAIGVPSEGPGTALDCKAPVPVELPGGRRILARGRIDRVDRVGERGFALWDYKTGGTYGYDRNDPFRAGRRVQNVLYTLMAERRLREVVGPEARALSFGYFFPSRRADGERIVWSADALREGAGVVARLCDLMAAGCFPFTPDDSDVTYSDFREAFDDPAAAAAAIKRKLENPGNTMLEPFRELRGIEPREASDE